jgi:hypothetical protein
MKIFNLVFAILFVVAAALQYNDPDPWLWIPLYMYAAVICWYAFRGKFYAGPALAGIVVYAVYALYLFFAEDGVADWLEEHNAESISKSMKATKPWIEATREFFGLCILIFVLLINYLVSRKKRVVAKIATTRR